jgi:hypothetical protein
MALTVSCRQIHAEIKPLPFALGCFVIGFEIYELESRVKKKLGLEHRRAIRNVDVYLDDLDMNNIDRWPVSIAQDVL